MHARFIKLIAALSLVASACATTRTTTWTQPPPGQFWERNGQVEGIREIVQTTEGQPAMGAAAGAVVGGFIGGLLTGRPAGAVIGAVEGAMVGASASQGYSEHRSYDVAVLFDDGGRQVLHFNGYAPFQQGQPVTLTPRGLVARATFAPSAPPDAAAPPESVADSPANEPPTAQPDAIPPPPEEDPYPPGTAAAAAPSGTLATPDGEWVFTGQYGWVFMPYGASYTYTPDYERGDPYMYVYYPSRGWSWVVAPWVWGWGAVPRFGGRGGAHFGWYGHGWGDSWRGHRSVHYRPGGGGPRYGGGRRVR